MNILLDTQIVIRTSASPGDRPSSLLQAVRDPANTLFLSVISGWEIAFKTSLGKLTIEGSLDEYLLDFEQTFDCTILPVMRAHTLAVQHLPHLHRDPFDRMLVAQAQVEGLAIATTDRQLAGYGVPIIG